MLIRDGKSYSIFFFRSYIICLDQELYFAFSDLCYSDSKNKTCKLSHKLNGMKRKSSQISI